MNLLADPAPSHAVVAAFSVLVVAVAGTTVAGVSAAARANGEDAWALSRRRRNVVTALAAWLAVTAVAAASGVLANFESMPPPLMLLIVASVLLSTALAFSRLGGLLAGSLPIAALVGFHAFRLPLELILHQLSLDGVLPVQMTYDGMNFDIATGISAVVVALWAASDKLPRAVLLLWNLFGLALLLTIVTIAVLSTPLPLRVFMNEPANTIIATVPFVWLPTVLVQAAWIGHLLIFRRLWQGPELDRR